MKKRLGFIVLALAVVGGAYYLGMASRGDTAATLLPSTTAAPTVKATAKPTVAAGPKACVAAELKLAVGPDQGTAGTAYYSLVLSNAGQTTCTLYGYPGVSLVDGAGAQINSAAVRNTATTAAIVTLAPGAAAQASVGFPDPGNYGGACSIPSVSIKVYPPNETEALTAPLVQQACSGMSVTALTAAAHD